MKDDMKSKGLTNDCKITDNILGLDNGVSKMDAIKAFALFKCTSDQKLKKENLTLEQIENEENLLNKARNQCIKIINQEENSAYEKCCNEENSCETVEEELAEENGCCGKGTCCQEAEIIYKEVDDYIVGQAEACCMEAYMYEQEEDNYDEPAENNDNELVEGNNVSEIERECLQEKEEPRVIVEELCAEILEDCGRKESNAKEERKENNMLCGQIIDRDVVYEHDKNQTIANSIKADIDMCIIERSDESIKFGANTKTTEERYANKIIIEDEEGTSGMCGFNWFCF